MITPHESIRIHTVLKRADADVIADLASQIWPEHYTSMIGAAQVDYMLRAFQTADKIWQDLSETGMIYQWLSLAGQPVGYMAFRADPKQSACFLSKLYVLRSCRRHGYARLFLIDLTCWCQTQNLKKIWLTVNRNNHGSIAAYKKMGFSVIDELVTDIGCGYVMDDYVMAVYLNHEA